MKYTHFLRRLVLNEQSTQQQVEASQAAQAIQEPTAAPAQQAAAVVQPTPVSTPPVQPAVNDSIFATNISFGVALVISLLVSLFTSGAAVIAYDHWVAPKLVAVDVKGYIDEQKDLYLRGKITDVQLNERFEHMEKVIKSLPKNKIAVMGDAVIHGVEKVNIGEASSKEK